MLALFFCMTVSIVNTSKPAGVELTINIIASYIVVLRLDLTYFDEGSFVFLIIDIPLKRGPFQKDYDMHSLI